MSTISTAPLYLLPLIAGFKFLSDWEKTRYDLVRFDGQRLYFKAAFAGYLLVVLLFVLIAAGYSAQHCVSLMLLGQCCDLKMPESDALMLISLSGSPIAGYLIPKLLNFFTDEIKYLEKALNANELELVLWDAVYRESLILVDLNDRKAYAGYVFTSPELTRGNRKYIYFLPMISGFRDSEQKLAFTTFYEEIIRKVDKDLEHLDVNSFMVAVPVREVRSIRLFDVAAYVEFNDDNQNEDSNKQRGATI